MMEEEALNLLINGGANLAFAAFLYFQNKELKQRADDREKKLEERELMIREKYEKVISDYQKKEEVIRESMVKELHEFDKRLTILEQKIEQIQEIVSDIKSRFQRVS